MTTVKTLESTGLGTLAEAFNLAFVDYEVPLNLTEAQLEALLRRNGYDPSLSAGLFDGDRLVGFILTGRRGETAYDSGTAIIPSYSGQGYAKQMFSFLIPLLKKNGIKEYILEVIQTNEKALRLYEKLGFEKKRELRCYRIQRGMIKAEPSIGTVPASEVEDLSPLLPSPPSWQNSWVSALAAGVYRLARVDGGYVLFSPTGDVAQLFAHSMETALALLGAVAANTEAESIRLANVADPALQEMLTAIGFENFVNQWEMGLGL